MIKLNKYNDFLNESIFSKTFDDRIEELDELLISCRSNFGYANAKFNSAPAYDIKKANKSVSKVHFNILEIMRLLDNIIKRFGRSFNDEQILIFMKRFEHSLMIFKSTTFNLNDPLTKEVIISATEKLNSIIHIINLLQDVYNKNINFPSKIDGKTQSYYFVKESEYWWRLIRKDELDKLKKEKKEKHKGVDPYGEEEWDDEVFVKNEGVKWYRDGKLVKDENEEEEEIDNFNVELMNEIDKLIKKHGGFNIRVYEKDYEDFCKFLRKNTIISGSSLALNSEQCFSSDFLRMVSGGKRSIIVFIKKDWKTGKYFTSHNGKRQDVDEEQYGGILYQFVVTGSGNYTYKFLYQP